MVVIEVGKEKVESYTLNDIQGKPDMKENQPPATMNPI
jgi:hypothetical protein